VNFLRPEKLMPTEKLKLTSLTHAWVVALVCVCAAIVFPQQSIASNIGHNYDRGWGATSPEKQQSTPIDKHDIHDVGGAVLPPKLVHAPSPKYTYAARRARLEGDCLIALVVDTQGKPQDISVEKGLDKCLDQNAMKAVKKYRFEPATMNGKPVPARIKIDVHFSIY
jgi:TonB family protein